MLKMFFSDVKVSPNMLFLFSPSFSLEPLQMSSLFTCSLYSAIFKLISCTIIFLKWRLLLLRVTSVKMDTAAFAFSFQSFAALPPRTFVITPALKGEV